MHGSDCLISKLRTGRFTAEVNWSFAESLLLENNFMAIHPAVLHSAEGAPT